MRVRRGHAVGTLAVQQRTGRRTVVAVADCSHCLEFHSAHHRHLASHTTTTTTTLHLFSGLFSRTTLVNWYQKGRTSLDLNDTRDDGVLGWQWHQLDHMQTICTLLQSDNHTNTSSLNFTGQMLFLTPNQQCQSTEGRFLHYRVNYCYSQCFRLSLVFLINREVVSWCTSNGILDDHCTTAKSADFWNQSKFSSYTWQDWGKIQGLSATFSIPIPVMFYHVEWVWHHIKTLIALT